MKTLKIIQTLAKIGQILSKVVAIFCIVGFFGCFFGIIGLAVGAAAVKIGGVTLESFLYTEADMSLGTLYASMAVGMVLCAGECVLAAFAAHYFKRELADGTPFDLGGAKEMTRLGILAIGISLAAQTVAAIVYAVLKATLADVGPLDLNASSSVSVGIMFIVMSLLCRLGAEQKSEKEIGNKSGF